MLTLNLMVVAGRDYVYAYTLDLLAMFSVVSPLVTASMVAAAAEDTNAIFGRIRLVRLA